MVSVVVPTTIPRYSPVPGLGRAFGRLAVGMAEGARNDRRLAQEAEACAMECDVVGNLTCEMH